MAPLIRRALSVPRHSWEDNEGSGFSYFPTWDFPLTAGGACHQQLPMASWGERSKRNAQESWSLPSDKLAGISTFPGDRRLCIMLLWKGRKAQLTTAMPMKVTKTVLCWLHAMPQPQQIKIQILTLLCDLGKSLNPCRFSILQWNSTHISRCLGRFHELTK